jgi:hypothetical protein
MRAHTPVPLDALRNARAATRDDERHRGGVNAWGNSYPAEELPFGGTLRVAGVPFALPPAGAEHDHVETLGQTLALPAAEPCTGVALLCFGEMGDQALPVDLFAEPDGHMALLALAKGWLLPPGAPDPPDGWVCSHLHYPGGYELDQLRPVLWCNSFGWEAPRVPTRLGLGTNPLFHLVAVTLLHGAVRSPDGAAHGR